MKYIIDKERLIEFKGMENQELCYTIDDFLKSQKPLEISYLGPNMKLWIERIK